MQAGTGRNWRFLSWVSVGRLDKKCAFSENLVASVALFGFKKLPLEEEEP